MVSSELVVLLIVCVGINTGQHNKVTLHPIVNYFVCCLLYLSYITSTSLYIIIHSTVARNCIDSSHTEYDPFIK